MRNNKRKIKKNKLYNLIIKKNFNCKKSEIACNVQICCYLELGNYKFG